MMFFWVFFFFVSAALRSCFVFLTFRVTFWAATYITAVVRRQWVIVDINRCSFKCLFVFFFLLCTSVQDSTKCLGFFFFWNNTFESSDRSVCVCVSQLGGVGVCRTWDTAGLPCFLPALLDHDCSGSRLPFRQEREGKDEADEMFNACERVGGGRHVALTRQVTSGAANRTVFSLTHTHRDTQTEPWKFVDSAGNLFIWNADSRRRLMCINDEVCPPYGSVAVFFSFCFCLFVKKKLPRLSFNTRRRSEFEL